ncbi:hypothetical protein CSV61_16065 [Sporosarcina sp. P3]|uniref:hypothetical protein n=1 Tax=Sporosarcina sp. P3 TaxID=2048245 RepID=UPI000C16DA52|nr:hypothetical protein [Sporosarcina sp. P3]PID20163.1 hypothetical protein CSV61_16065 [Sporosarcina sp. P3]
MNKPTNKDYEQLENYWHNYPNASQLKEEGERIDSVISKQFESMDEETQGIFKMAMAVSLDIEEAEDLPLTVERLEFVKNQVLSETARLVIEDFKKHQATIRLALQGGEKS